MSLHPDQPSAGEERDSLLQRYHEASATDTRQPSAAIRNTIQAAARADAAKRLRHTRQPANDHHWPWRAVAGIAVIGLAGLLFLQFERGTEAERDVLLGANPRPKATSTTAAASAPATMDEEAASAPLELSKAAPDIVARPDAAEATEKLAPPALPSNNKEEARVPPDTARAAANAAAASVGDVSSKQSPQAPVVRRAPAREPAAIAQKAPPMATAPGVSPASEAENLPAPEPAQEPMLADADDSGMTGKARAQARPPSLGHVAPEPSPDRAEAPEAFAYVNTGDAVGLTRWLAGGGHPDARNAARQTLLMRAAALGKADLVEALLSAGADRTLQDSQGRTAADLAREAGHEAVASRLAR